MPRPFSRILEQGGLVTLITRSQLDELLCLVPFGGRCLCFFSCVSWSPQEFSWGIPSQETLHKAAEGFRGRLERVMQARGGHIE